MITMLIVGVATIFTMRNLLSLIPSVEEKFYKEVAIDYELELYELRMK